MASVYTIKDIRAFKDRIDVLTLDGKKEIFKIVRANEEKYSENKNLILLDITRFKKATLDEISAFLDYSEDKQKALNNDEVQRDDYRRHLMQ